MPTPPPPPPPPPSTHTSINQSITHLAPSPLATQVSKLSNSVAGVDHLDRPYSLRPMLFHVAMLDVANKILQDPTLVMDANGKVGVGAMWRAGRGGMGAGRGADPCAVHPVEHSRWKC